MKRPDQTQVTLRLPADARVFLSAQAERNGSSMNSEVVRCIRDRMEKMATAGSEIGVLNPAVAPSTTNQETGDEAVK